MIYIEADLCIGCGRCLPTCPLRDFVLGEDDKAELVPPEKFICIECGHCVSVCPVGAISMDGDASESAPEAPELFPEHVAWLMKTRRSIRAYKPEPVPHEALQRALEVARYAPTARNMQEITWIATDNPATLKTIADYTANWLLNQPGGGHVGKGYFAGEDRILRGAPSLVLAQAPAEYALSAQDCAAAVSYLELILHARGIGSCWAGYIINAARNVPELRELLEVREGCAVFAGLMVGYSVETFQRIPGRKPVRLTWI